jgi:hypothetical protein
MRAKEIQMRVDVYYNLRWKTYSIRHKGIVVQHADNVIIENAEYAVGKAGRKRVLKEKRKNVHAYVRGELLFAGNSAEDYYDTFIEKVNEYSAYETEVNYNPYKNETFIDYAELPIYRSDWAEVTKENGVIAHYDSDYWSRLKEGEFEK